MEKKDTASIPVTRKKKSLKTIGFKLISMTSLIIFISMSVMILIATLYFKKDKQGNLNENNLKIAEVIAQKVNADLLYLQEKAGIIAVTFLQGGGADPQQKNLFTDLFFSNESDIIYVGIAENNDKTLVLQNGIGNDVFMKMNKMTSDDIRRIILSEQDSFNKSFGNEIIIHNSSLRFNQPVIGVAFPYSKKSETAADSILIVYFKMNRFLDAVKSYDIFKTFIVNRDGEIIAHYDPSIASKQVSFANLEIVKKMRESPTDNGQLPYNDEQGVPFLGAFKKIPVADIGVITNVKKDIAFEAVNRIQNINALITVIILTTAIFIVYFFAKTLTNPIKRLVDATKEIEQGKFNIGIKAVSKDEIGLLTESFVNMGKGLAEREKIKDAFGKFVNKEIAEMVLKDEIKLGGERKNGVVFFSDIRSFTALSETLQPEEVVDFLNEYLTQMVACINKTQGVVDKFMGDGIMATWGVPVSRGNDTENAINCGLMMRKVLYTYNKMRVEKNKPLIKIGIGINTGPILAGQIGSQDRMEYTVIGDAVNLASRIEQLNKPFGTDILISEESYNLVENIFYVIPMQKIRVKGKSETQQIYAVLGRLDDPKRIDSLELLRRVLGINESDLENSGTLEKKYEILD